MKYSLYIITTAFVLMACNKSADRQHIPLSFTGKWYFTEQYMSIGGPGQWNPVEKSGQWIELNSNGGFSSTLSPFDKATNYEIKDSVHIKFFSPLRSDSLYYFYKLDSSTNSLTLSPAIYICIEGCAQKFEKSPKLF